MCVFVQYAQLYYLLHCMHSATDPIHDDKVATDDSYNRNADYLLSHNDTYVFLATHNSGSVEVAKKK